MKHAATHLPLPGPACNSCRLSASEFVRLLHPADSHGLPSLCAKTGKDRLFSRSLPPEVVTAQIETWLETETYITMNRFHGPRSGSRLAALNALFLDFDFYKTLKFRAMRADEFAAVLERRVVKLGLPEPSFVIDSGRGCYAIWLHSSLPKKALPRWQALLRTMLQKTKDLGADTACSDPARILRVPGTWNSKIGREVSVLKGSHLRYDFDDLADAFYAANGRPTRSELIRWKTGKNERNDQVASKTKTHFSGLPPKQRFTLIERDLLELVRAWGGRVPEGVRNTWLHLYATAISHIDPRTDLAHAIMNAASKFAPGLSTSEVEGIIRSTHRRVEQITYSPGPPLKDGNLHYSGNRIAELLGVTDRDARRLGLRQVIPSEVRKERKAEKERDRRRAAGSISRDAWLAENSVSKQKPWNKLGISRSTYYKRGLHRAELSKVEVKTSETGPCPQQGGYATHPEGAKNHLGHPMQPNPPIPAKAAQPPVKRRTRTSDLSLLCGPGLHRRNESPVVATCRPRLAIESENMFLSLEPWHSMHSSP
jgi:hypothetical protein